MTNSEIKRRALRAGLIIKQRCKGTVLEDPITGESIFFGNRSHHGPHSERQYRSFLRKREKGGLD